MGSQCRNPQNWRVGIERAKKVFADMRRVGLTSAFAQYRRRLSCTPCQAHTLDRDNSGSCKCRDRGFTQGYPRYGRAGRYLVSDAAYFVCRVVGTATRNGKRWMYWDAGVFGGVIEVTEGLRYEILSDRKGQDIPWSIAGPTCDSVDILMRDEMLPEDIEEGDFIYIPNAGAYTTAYASNFNGFPLPDVVVL